MSLTGHRLSYCEISMHFPLVLMNRLNKTESVVFLYYRFSLFLKDPDFFSDYPVVLKFMMDPVFNQMRLVESCRFEYEYKI